MAIDFGRAARGIATGYLSAKVADTAAQDELNRDFILQARNQYFNVDKPNFVADEKLRSANINLISTNLNPIVANYADYSNITLDKTATLKFIKDVENLSDDERFNLESTITQRKKGRTQTFDDKHAHVLNNEMFKSGGSGSMNMMKVFFPKEGEDIAEVGVKQGDVPITEKITPLSEIIGTGGNVYDIDNTAHRNIESKASTQFNTLFFDRVQQKYNFSIPSDKNNDGSFKDSRYPTLQVVKEGYADAVKQGYEFGFEVYARDKFIQRVMESRGIEGYTGLLPQETPAAEAEVTTTETKAVPEDGKKFDVGQIGVKEDANINKQRLRPIEGEKAVSVSTVLNDLREIIARISNSPSLSDDEKEQRIELAKQRVRDKIQSMGLDLDKFNI